MSTTTSKDVRHHIVDNLITPYELPSKKSTMEVYDEISLDWKTQIYNHVVRQFGGKPSSYLQGVNKDTLLPALAVEEFAKVVITEYDSDPRLAADALKAAMTEHITLMSAMAMNQAMKEKGLMGQITKVTDNMIEQVNTKGEENEALKQQLERGPEGYAPNPADYASNASSVPVETVPVPTEEQFVNPKHVKFDSKGNVIKKRKKSKAKSNHIPNMKTKYVKSALGASILGMLGKVQRDTQDTQKKALLKALPAADVIEMATGKKLPDYQANLINNFQAKADPAAPVVVRQKDSILKDIQAETAKVLELTEQFEDSLPVARLGTSDDHLVMFYLTRKGGEEFSYSAWKIYEMVASEIGTTTTYVETHARGVDFMKGLNDAIIEHLHDKEFGPLEEIPGAVKEIYERLLVGYITGFVKGIADSVARVAKQLAVASSPAKLD